ncbi:hypothetical protein BCV72DRAFT_321315 [Rhizopus microsporus var. microsporus]|uniref:Uncharacterized protein n=1 Tax=Rhizopus microsporus var. microsporus TaxID=86635 RepID=A0A1X0RAJ6_RHIZD|nr:hypothetical protein BCV72DRAFT_321315 [Rhizopus microsporus var. microsporus]
MNQLSAIGAHPKGFSSFLGTRFYSHIVRAQLEYGLAIIKSIIFLSKQLEDAQNVCLRRIFGGTHTSFTTVMLHMSKLPAMQERAYTLQFQSLLRSLTLPEDALLHLLLLIRQPRSHSQWYKLYRSSIWKRCPPNPKSLDRRSLRSKQREYRQDNLNNKRSTHISILLTYCRPTISLDLSERSRCICWRLGWLPGGRYKTLHTIHCLQMHRRLMMSQTISDPLSFLLNMLPTKKPRSPNTTLSWTIRWPTICRILYEPDYLYQAKPPPTHPLTSGKDS